MTAPHPHPFWPKDLPGAFTLPATSLHANLRIAAERYPHKPAYVYYGSTLTWGALRRDAEALAGWLQQRCGVARGDRVALMLPQRPETAIAHIAVYQMGAVAVPLSFLFGPEALEYRLVHSATKVAIVDPQSLPNFAPIR